jgi:hypothetical protein
LPHQANHRGAAPEDDRLFSADAVRDLRRAADDLCWLRDRGYAQRSALELVGSRFNLQSRQRLAVGRCVAPAETIRRRQARCIGPDQWRGEELWLDGYNVLMVLEAALGGGVVLLGRDQCCRDVLGIHGSYHRVQETRPALEFVGEVCQSHGVARCHWFLDRPVSNSGRLRSHILAVATQRRWDWEVELVMNPDKALAASAHIVATADGAILDACSRWANLARVVISDRVPGARLVDLSQSADEPN